MTTRDKVLFALLICRGKATYQKVLSFLPPGYRNPNFYGILRRMEADQLIKRSPDRQMIPRLAGLRLGPDALSFLESRFGPRIRSLLIANNATMKQFDNDQAFSLVIYDFPLSMAYQRARLQTKLEQLGMGMLRRGVYVSPYDVSRLIAAWAEENQILDRIYLIKSDHIGQNQLSSGMAEKIWHLSALVKQYVSLLDRLGIVKGQQIPEKRISGLRRIKSDFIELAVRDPFVPQTFLPPGWPFERVRESLLSID